MTRITPQTAAIQKAVLAIKDRLNEASIDETIPHEEIRALMPDELRRGSLTHYVLVARAQRLLNAENGAVFATVRGEGYRRLANVVGADYASDLSLVRIRRESRRGQQVTTMAIRFANNIGDNDKRRMYQKLSTLGLIEHLTLKKSVQTMPETRPIPDPLAGLRDMMDQAAGK